MIVETTPSGLIIARDKPEPKPMPPDEEFDGSIPLEAGRGGNEWLKRLTPEQKDELIAHFPRMFLGLGMNGAAFGALRDVKRLRARTEFLAGVAFEELT